MRQKSGTAKAPAEKVVKDRPAAGKLNEGIGPFGIKCALVKFDARSGSF